MRASMTASQSFWNSFSAPAQPDQDDEVAGRVEDQVGRRPDGSCCHRLTGAEIDSGGGPRVHVGNPDGLARHGDRSRPTTHRVHRHDAVAGGIDLGHDVLGARGQAETVRRSVEGIDAGRRDEGDDDEPGQDRHPAPAGPELAGEPGPARRWDRLDPVERDAPGDPLQLLGAKTRVAVREIRSRQGPDGVGHEDLAGSCLGADPGGDVDRAPDQPFGRGDRLAGMDPDPDPERGIAGRGLDRRGDDLESGLDRRRGRREDDVDRVALGLDLGPGVGCNRRPDEAAVRREEIGCRLVAAGFDECRVAAQVAEQEAVRSGRTGARSHAR